MRRIVIFDLHLVQEAGSPSTQTVDISGGLDDLLYICHGIAQRKIFLHVTNVQQEVLFVEIEHKVIVVVRII